jgi:DNA-binding winged helix-turn-helix (wHTH) protein
MKKIAPFIALFLLSMLLMQFVWAVSEPSQRPGLSAEKVNLALRRSADKLLKEAGDSSSRIPPVEKAAANVWLLRLENNFNYDLLPAILQESFDVHGISDNYDVAVLRCLDGNLELGYNFKDFSENKDAPCGGRDMESGCYNIQVTFLTGESGHKGLPVLGWLFSGMLAIALYGLRIKWGRGTSKKQIAANVESNWVHFGESRLDAANLLLFCGSVRHQLTYREAKLLHLFAQQPNQVLERSFILDNVWADEGVIVGRSVDMFVSRLRKMLRDDPSVQLVAVHGVGYRLEVGVV